MPVTEASPTASSPAAPAAARSAPGPVTGRATRVAVVGTGYIADTHLEALREVPAVEVVALCDVDLARAEAAARKHRVARAVRRLEDLRDGVDVVHLCVPPDLHARVARECLELGLSVFVEKPLALASGEARELGALARERGLVLGANHNSIFHPAFVRLLERVRAGAIGRVEHVAFDLAVPLRQLDARDFSHWMFREPRNIVFEQAVHPFAQVVELIGAPREVRAHVLATRELAAGQPFHERWNVSARAEHGTLTAHLAFGATFQKSTLTVRGSDGCLEADLHRNLLCEEGKTLWLDFWDAYLAGTRRGAALKRDARAGLAAYLKQTLRLARRQDAFYAGMRGSIRAFHAAWRAGKTPAGSPERAATVLAWCEACVRDLPPAPARPRVEVQDTPARPGEVVVLGANGFIGRETVTRLLSAGIPTSAGVRRTHGLPDEITAPASEGRLRLVRGSLADADALRAAVRGARVVLHLATGGGATWDEVQRQMVGGTRSVAEACLAESVERLVFVSSIAALYLGPDVPEPVQDDAPTDQRPELRPVYARGKIAAEALLRELARTKGLRVTIVRPGVVVGAGTALQHSGIGLWVRDNHCVGWGHGNRPLPLVLVEDVADALVRLARHAGSDLDGQALNLAANGPFTAAELVAELARRTGRALHFHPRSLALSQALEIGKWLVKKAGGRKDGFPSYRDLKSRSLAPRLACRTARETLGWKPVEDRATFLARMVPPAPEP